MEKHRRMPAWWNEQKPRLRALSGRVFELLERQTLVDVGLLSRTFLDDFVSGCYCLIDILVIAPPSILDALPQCADTTKLAPLSELNPTARILCRLSRDVLFSLDTER